MLQQLLIPHSDQKTHPRNQGCNPGIVTLGCHIYIQKPKKQTTTIEKSKTDLWQKSGNLLPIILLLQLNHIITFSSVKNTSCYFDGNSKHQHSWLEISLEPEKHKKIWASLLLDGGKEELHFWVYIVNNSKLRLLIEPINILKKSWALLVSSPSNIHRAHNGPKWSTLVCLLLHWCF